MGIKSYLFMAAAAIGMAEIAARTSKEIHSRNKNGQWYSYYTGKKGKAKHKKNKRRQK